MPAGSKTGRERQPEQCVIRLNTAGNWNSEASVKYVPQRDLRGARGLGHFPHFWPAPGHTGGSGGQRRSPGKEIAVLAVGGQAAGVHSSAKDKDTRPSLLC